MEIIYRYDGTFSGFLSCVFDSYARRESPVDFQTADAAELTLFAVRWVETDEAHARRVMAGIKKRSAYGAELVVKGFLTCVPRREAMLLTFIRALLGEGGILLQRMSDPAVLPVLKAVRHLEGEVHLLKGFVRFSQLGDVLVGEIRPKNRVLPLLRPHFCGRYPEEKLMLYDRAHHEALFTQNGQWSILPLEHFSMAAPDQQEADIRRLWKRFYDTVAIRERYNPRCRRTHMPMRYWETMTEFQGEAYFRARPDLPANPEGRIPPAAAGGPGAPAGIPAPGTRRGSGPSGPG